VASENVDWELLNAQLEEDVLAFQSLLATNSILPAAAVRIVTASVLRKWLLDGWLNKLGVGLGISFTFPSLDTSVILRELEDHPEIEYFLSGGVWLGGHLFQGVYSSSCEYIGTPPISIDKMTWSNLSAKELLRSKKIYFRGEWFSVEKIIRHMAHKIGGVHFDTSRKHLWEIGLDEAAAYLEFGNPDFSSEMELVDYGNCMKIVFPRETGQVWNCIYVEMLATAGSFCNVLVNGEPLLVSGELP